MAQNGHIMLSYQWDYQTEVRQIRDALKRAGVNVWMDIDKMSGNIYEKMSEGVEGASIIIVCMTSKYQTSENCNKEFQYAQVSKKKIIPIKLEKGFNATGALGLITAGQLYIDFSNMSKFNENMESLKKEIQTFSASSGNSEFYFSSLHSFDLTFCVLLFSAPFSCSVFITLLRILYNDPVWFLAICN